MTLNGVMAVTLRYFSEVGKPALQKTICGGIYARVYCIFIACTMSSQRKFTFAISSPDEFLVNKVSVSVSVSVSIRHFLNIQCISCAYTAYVLSDVSVTRDEQLQVVIGSRVVKVVAKCHMCNNCFALFYFVINACISHVIISFNNVNTLLSNPEIPGFGLS